MQSNQVLFQEVKDHLQITWDDEDTNRRLNRSIKSSKTYLNSITGVEIDFDGNDFARDLLLEFCRYDDSKSREYFKVNYQSELIQLQLMEGVKTYEENTQL